MRGTALQAAITITPQHRSEPTLRAAIAQTLRAHGIGVDEQVACAAGAADLVTVRRDVIYEVKLWLSRKALQQAVGQLMLYRASLNPEARAIIVGYATEETAVLRPYIEALGIEVVYWNDEAGVVSWDLEVEDREFIVPTFPTTRAPSSLGWRVAAQAQTIGIPNVRELSFAMHTNRQSLYPIWQGRAKSISLAMLGRLSQTLAADPGGWFRWDSDDLVWNVREVAEVQRMSVQDLVWACGILPHSLTLIWRGTQQFVFVETLQKLARALDLHVGELFVWKELSNAE